MLYHIKRVVEIRRSPCGERGLKFSPVAADAGHAGVAPRAGSVD